MIGRLSHEKGVDLFLRAFRLLRAGGLPAQAVIAGDGPERVRLLDQALELGIGDAVRFLGPVYPAAPLYAELDLVVIPSRSEGLPNVLLEALSADSRIVATDVGAVADVLSEPVAGRVVPPGDVNALAEAMRTGLGEAPAAGTAARRAILERFSLAARAATHAALYHDLIGNRAAPLQEVLPG